MLLKEKIHLAFKSITTDKILFLHNSLKHIAHDDSNNIKFYIRKKITDETRY